MFPSHDHERGTTPPSCASLGYDKSTSDCTDQPSLKCPFDNSKLFCIPATTSSSCRIGDILYSDKSCNNNVVASKTAIGVVFDTTYRLAIALTTTKADWSTTNFDVQDLTQISSSTTILADWHGKSNTATVLSYCKANGKSCPAFDYVSTYKTAGTSVGDWYLPALGEVNAIYSNKTALSNGLSKVGKREIEINWHWSSSQSSGSGSAWGMRFMDGYSSDYGKSTNSSIVRPVLAF